MRAKDITVGEYYAFQYGSLSRYQRALVLSTGEKELDRRYYYRTGKRKVPTGTEIKLDDGTVMVVNSRYIMEPWEQYHKKAVAKEEGERRQADAYRDRQLMRKRLEHSLENAGLGHVSNYNYSDHLSLRLYSAGQIELLCAILDWYSATFEDETDHVQDKGHPFPEPAGITIDGANVHSTIRRMMDSRGSSILYNAISTCPDAIWVKILLFWSQAPGETLRDKFGAIDWIKAELAFDSNARLVRMGFEGLDGIEWALLEKVNAPVVLASD